MSETGEWGLYRDIVVDTGAPISLLPSQIWRGCRYRSLGATKIGEISTRPECRLDATLAEIECLLSDGADSIGPIKMFAYLAETDAAPTLLGISGFLQRGCLHLRLKDNEHYLEM